MSGVPLRTARGPEARLLEYAKCSLTSSRFFGCSLSLRAGLVRWSSEAPQELVAVVVPNVAWARVLGMQTRLHQWATDDPKRRFDDLYNLVYDPAFLVVNRYRGQIIHTTPWATRPIGSPA
jgi:hypothetical protein